MDRAMPRADDLPSFKVDTGETPCMQPAEVKGCEAGAIGSPAAVINAITDALWPLGVRDIEMPASGRVWRDPVRKDKEEKTACLTSTVIPAKARI